MAYKYIAEFHKDRGEEELAREYYGRSETWDVSKWVGGRRFLLKICLNQ
jgi:hypothetical protein